MRFLLFLLLNFGALYIGALLMGGSPAENNWYNQLPKAPWTPPGWVFGAAWTTIMICFTFYMSKLYSHVPSAQRKFLVLLFSAQWLLNVLWNPVFFNWHFIAIGALVISTLLGVLIFMHVKLARGNKILLFLLLPYLVWLAVALSLNLYPLIFKG